MTQLGRSMVPLSPAPPPDDLFHNISPEIIKAFLAWIERMATTLYEVVVTNGLDEDLASLTIVYRQNVLVNGHIVVSPPATKSLAALPPGESVDFHLCPCLQMATNYVIAFSCGGQTQQFMRNISDTNEQEKQDGVFDFCRDSYQFFFE